MSSLKAQCEEILKQFDPSLDVLAYGHLYNMPTVIERSVKACAQLPLSAIDIHKKREPEVPDSLMLQVLW